MTLRTPQRAHLTKFVPLLAVATFAAIAATGADEGLTLSPVKGTLTDEPVVQDHCGRWQEHGISERIAPLEHGLDPRSVYDGRLELLDGFQGCTALPMRSGGCTRKAKMPALEASNKLWFNWEDRTEQERTMTVEGEWGRRYTYTPGSGSLAPKGTKARIVIDAKVEVELALDRRGPECSPGGCASGDGLAQATLELEGLVPLAPELQRFFDDRAEEDHRQEWYHLPEHPETLRRRVSLAHNWCRETAIESWQLGIEYWPPSIELGGSGPNGAGEVVMPKIMRRLQRKLPVCIRPPTGESGSASFEIKIVGRVEATTKIAAAATSRTTSTVTVSRLQVTFSEGCIDCDPAGEPGLQQQGGSTGAG